MPAVVEMASGDAWTVGFFSHSLSVSLPKVELAVHVVNVGRCGHSVGAVVWWGFHFLRNGGGFVLCCTRQSKFIQFNSLSEIIVPVQLDICSSLSSEFQIIR